MVGGGCLLAAPCLVASRAAALTAATLGGHSADPQLSWLLPCRAAPSSDWEGMVSLNRNTLSGEFFKYLDLRIK